MWLVGLQREGWKYVNRATQKVQKGAPRSLATLVKSPAEFPWSLYFFIWQGPQGGEH